MKKIFLTAMIFAMALLKVNAQKAVTAPVVPVPEHFKDNVQIFFQMSDEEEKEYLKSLTPSLRADLEEIKKLNKETYYDLLREAHFARFDFPFVDKGEKERFDIDKKLIEYNISTELLGLKYQNAGESERSKFKVELMKKIGEMFDLKEQQRKMEVAQLQKELEELKKSLAVRKNNKDAIVLKRFNELTGVGDYLDWD